MAAKRKVGKKAPRRRGIDWGHENGPGENGVPAGGWDSVDRRRYEPGQLVLATGTHPYWEEFRRTGAVGIVESAEHYGPEYLDVTPRSLARSRREQLRKWGPLAYAWVLFGGRRVSMGPDDLKHIDWKK